MKREQKFFDLPERGFEPQIFSNFPAHDLNQNKLLTNKSPNPTTAEISYLRPLVIIVTWYCKTSNSQPKGHLCTYTKGSRKLPEAPFYCFYRVSIVPFTIGSAVFKTTIDVTGRGLKSWPTHTWDWQKKL